jgi:localization factor PodJL
MAPEVRWQASSAASSSGGHTLAPDRESVESLLRKLIKRIEESERRYEEALDELHARLGQVSYSASVNKALGTPEETETLERLRRQLSDLARRLEQPQPKKMAERLPRLDKAFDEVRAVSAGLALAEPDWFASLSASLAAAEGRVEPEPARAPLPASEPSYASQSFAPSPSIDEDADFDRRLIDMAQRLERSIGGAMPSSAIEKLNARMEEISAGFEAALAQEPKLETLHHIERQVADMGFQLGRVEQQATRIGAVEGQLQRLIERIEATPAQIERTATKAAQETARLVSETGLGKPSAAERLDALHRDKAMNERNLATADRLVDTLTAMHESLKGLMQRERDRAAATALCEAPPRMEPAASEAGAADFAQSRQPVAAAQIQAAEPPRQCNTLIRDIPFESTEDLVAAARRAAQAAAARAEERNALPQRKVRATAETKPSEEPGRHKVSLLMVAAAILLMISAALLLTRLKLKPDFDAPPPAAEQSMPAPAAEAPPLPDTPLQTEVIPSPEGESMPSSAATPEVLPESEAPDAAPTAPHAITPSSSPDGTGARSPVHLGDGAAEALVR